MSSCPLSDAGCNHEQSSSSVSLLHEHKYEEVHEGSEKDLGNEQETVQVTADHRRLCENNPMKVTDALCTSKACMTTAG